MRAVAWILGILAVVCLAGGMGAAQKAGLLWQSGQGLQPQQAVMWGVASILPILLGIVLGLGALAAGLAARRWREGSRPPGPVRLWVGRGLIAVGVAWPVWQVAQAVRELMALRESAAAAGAPPPALGALGTALIAAPGPLIFGLLLISAGLLVRGRRAAAPPPGGGPSGVAGPPPTL